ncbi:hypothetical protein GEMRC1_003203 [Eukaryota sp. GEM-RC1]
MTHLLSDNQINELASDVAKLREEAETVLSNAFRLTSCSFPRISAIQSPVTNPSNFCLNYDLEFPLYAGLDPIRSQIPSTYSSHPLFIVKGPPSSGRSSVLSTALPYLLSSPPLFKSLPNYLLVPFSRLQHSSSVPQLFDNFLSLLKLLTRQFLPSDIPPQPTSLNSSFASPRRTPTTTRHAFTHIPWSDSLNSPVTFSSSLYPSTTHTRPPQDFVKTFKRPVRPFDPVEEEVKGVEEIDVEKQIPVELSHLSEVVAEIVKFLRTFTEHTGNCLICFDDFDEIFKFSFTKSDKSLILKTFSYIISHFPSQAVFCLSFHPSLIFSTPEDLSRLVPDNHQSVVIDCDKGQNVTETMIDDIVSAIDNVIGQSYSEPIIRKIVDSLPLSTCTYAVVFGIFSKFMSEFSTDFDFQSDLDSVVSLLIDEYFKFSIIKNSKKFGYSLSVFECSSLLSWSYATVRLPDDSAVFYNDLFRLISLSQSVSSVTIKKDWQNLPLSAMFLKIVSVCDAGAHFKLDRSLIEEWVLNNDVNFSEIFNYFHDLFRKKSKLTRRVVSDYFYTDFLKFLLQYCFNTRKFDFSTLDSSKLIDLPESFATVVGHIITNFFHSLRQFSSFLTCAESAITSSNQVLVDCSIVLEFPGKIPKTSVINSFFVENFHCRPISTTKVGEKIVIILNSKDTCSKVLKRKVLTIQYERGAISKCDEHLFITAWEMYQNNDQDMLENETLNTLKKSL